MDGVKKRNPAGVSKQMWFPTELYGQILKLARENCRTFGRQVVFMLKEGRRA